MMPLLLSVALLLSPDVRTPDPTLAAFTLQEDDTTPEASAPEVPSEDSRSRAWRYLGWLNYAAAGTAAGSQFYREDRSFGWDPSPENVQLRVGLVAGGAEGANMLSDRLYESNRRLAWLTRISSIAVLGYTASVNFQRGWERR